MRKQNCHEPISNKTHREDEEQRQNRKILSRLRIEPTSVTAPNYLG